MRLFISAILFFMVPTVFANEQLISIGDGFDKEAKEKKFTYERYQKVEGGTVTSRAVYKDLDGEVMTEETMVEKGGKLVRYDMDQKQLKQTAWIEIKDGSVEYNLKKFKKNNYPQSDKLKENFVVGLQIVDLIRSNWDNLVNKKDVEFHLGVWHRQETIKFKLSQESKDDKTLVVKMNPSSMLIRAVVDPLYFTMDLSDKTLVKYQGRTTPKEKRGRDFYDFDGLVIYKKVGSSEAPKPAQAPLKKEGAKTK